ncbi:MAG: MerR family transcriptional regulator [Flavobacteriaceae bacterium]
MHFEFPSEKRYFSIGEVAKGFDVNTSLLRFWEKSFPELNPQKKANGIRKYTHEDIQVIQLIHHLVKEKGMTIAGAKNQMVRLKKGGNEGVDILQKLQKIKAKLEELNQHL